MIVGEDPEALGRQNGTQSIDGLLDEASLAKKIQNLLGAGAPAARPEPRSAAACQNQAIVVGLRHIASLTKAFENSVQRIPSHQLKRAIPARFRKKVLGEIPNVVDIYVPVGEV